MKAKALALSTLVTLGAVSTNANAEEALSVTPHQVWNLVQTQPEQVLFVDVRDPIEIMFIGGTNAVDINIPFKVVDRHDYRQQQGVFAMKDNPKFSNQIEKALQDKGLTKDALVITMCRSGSARGKPSADYLLSNGFSNVKYVDHGFQGSAIKEGERKGFRIINGWQNSGLPWSPKLDADKIYQP